MKSIDVTNFNLKETLKSGQFFLYTLIDDFYYIVHTNQVFKVKQENDKLYYDNVDESYLVEFFNLDKDYEIYYKEFDDDLLQEALERYRGIRIIKQDLWQCLVSFICSACSNIPKITKNLELISEYFGDEVELDGYKFYTFPKVGDMVDYKKLRDAKTGYRADYLYEVNEMLSATDLLEEIKSSDYRKSKELLMSLPGIGSKVADCICLFSLGHLETFPVDTWVKKIVERYYLFETSTPKKIEEFGKKHFGKYAGVKQQYLFHHIRNAR